ncbi:MAG: hypothetical protein WBD47_04630 [Phormidesmis sp.]
MENEATQATGSNIKSKIREAISALQADLENVVKEIFEQAGKKIRSERREDVEQGITKAMLLLEKLKSRYV